MKAFGGQLGRPRAKNRGPKVMRKRLQILKSRPTEPEYPQNPPETLRKAAVADPLELSLTIKTNRPQHALHHCKAVGGGSMTAGAVSATVPSIVLVYQLSEFREQIAEVRTYLGICGLARRHWPRKLLDWKAATVLLQWRPLSSRIGSVERSETSSPLPLLPKGGRSLSSRRKVGGSCPEAGPFARD